MSILRADLGALENRLTIQQKENVKLTKQLDDERDMRIRAQRSKDVLRRAVMEQHEANKLLSRDYDLVVAELRHNETRVKHLEHSTFII